jgi:hypothetical protein
MRYTLLAAALLTVGLAMPAAVANEQTETPVQAMASAPTWNQCFYLAWIRGVHVEQQELPDFMDQCLAGAVPFGTDFEKYVKETGH